MAREWNDPFGLTVDLLSAEAFEALPDITVVVDRKGTVLEANRAARLAIGEPLIGRHCHELFHTGVSHPAFCPVCQTVVAGTIPSQPFEVEWRPGRWHQILLAPLAGGSPGFVQVSRDITAQREGEASLRRTAHGYRALVDNLPQAVFLKDTELRLISCNRGYAALTGLDPDALPGTAGEGLRPRELAERFRRENLRVMASGVTDEFEDVFEVNGRQFTSRVMKKPVKDERGTVVGLLGIFSDITETKRAEERLRETQLRYEAILKNAGDAILIADHEGRFIEANHRAEELFGFTREELLRMRVPELCVDQGARERAAQELDLLGTSLSEHRLLRKDGKAIHVEASATRIPWEGAHVFLATFRDITRRKQIEAELATYRDHLEELVEARTQELRAANRELEAFSYSVSHDLRSPLRAINGFAEALREELAAHQLSDDAHCFLSRMSAATVRMSELIDGLLDLAKVSRTEIRAAEVDLSALANSQLAALREAEPARKVECCVEPGLTAVGDPMLLQMLVGNLLDNAWKFTSRRDDALIVFGRTPSGSGEVFHVRDNGAGFDMQFASKLFQPFMRLHDQGEFQGTGVGLATVKRIAERHGGSAWAEGRPGEGATVYFSLAARRGVVPRE